MDAIKGKMMDFYVCEKMQKLRDWLDDQQIPWEDVSSDYKDMIPEPYNTWMCRTHFEYKDNFYSVIHGYGSYGGLSLLHVETLNHNLLEMMDGNHEPIGYLTAEEVKEYVLGTKE